MLQSTVKLPVGKVILSFRLLRKGAPLDSLFLFFFFATMLLATASLLAHP
jgi:hypothetical protein